MFHNFLICLVGRSNLTPFTKTSTMLARFKDDDLKTVISNLNGCYYLVLPYFNVGVMSTVSRHLLCIVFYIYPSITHSEKTLKFMLFCLCINKKFTNTSLYIIHILLFGDN